tara:strand:- start:99 stop:521 length:423 start_codon:yes stop_codon:yes gene_type:complete
MNILVIHGPNLNLIGLQSSKNKHSLTLDKLNKELKLHARQHGLTLKIYQTHKEFQALNILQRNRNWATGLLMIPTSWARNNFTLLETIRLINIKTAMIFFEGDFSFGTKEKDSVLINDNIKNFSGEPFTAIVNAVDYLRS